MNVCYFKQFTLRYLQIFDKFKCLNMTQTQAMFDCAQFMTGRLG